MALPRDWNHGGSAQVPGYGKPNLRDLLNGLHGLPDLATLKALPANERSDGMLARVVAGGKWRWADASVLAGDDKLVVDADDAPAAGAWLRDDSFLDVKLAVAFGTLDAAVLWTVPAGWELVLAGSAWEVTTSFTGGTNSAIGLYSSNAGLSTPGDILGGAGGELAAALVSTGAKYKGTVGVKAGKPPGVLVGGDTVAFKRMVSAYAAGAGFAHLFLNVLVAPAA